MDHPSIPGTNLIGFVVRGLLRTPPSVDAPTDRVTELLLRESSDERGQRRNDNSRVCLRRFSSPSLFLSVGVLWRFAGVAPPDLLWDSPAGGSPAHARAPDIRLVTFFCFDCAASSPSALCGNHQGLTVLYQVVVQIFGKVINGDSGDFVIVEPAWKPKLSLYFWAVSKRLSNAASVISNFLTKLFSSEYLGEAQFL